MTRFFAIEEADVARIEAAARRLHTERRMNGDEMRDLGHVLAGVARVVREIPLQETDDGLG